VESVIAAYREVGRRVKADSTSSEVTDALRALFARCRGYLATTSRLDLISRVAGKQYFAFARGGSHSRAVNTGLYLEDAAPVEAFLGAVCEKAFDDLIPLDTTRACYTLAMAFCCAVDLGKDRDQQTPGTFFEYLMSHLFSRRLGVRGTREVEVLNLDMNAKLPTDYIFDLGEGKPKFHLPVKTSTRERAVQVWAHQRVLDGVYGTGRFSGILACLAETKLGARKLEVIEICVPLQWRLYQMFIAKMRRVYYLDLPGPYQALNDVFPHICVRPFGEFFAEVEALCGAA
jgi:hypothetical protein